jgi:ribonuclease D
MALPEHLINDPAQLTSCLERLARAPVIGFDTEFVGEDAYRPDLCLIQLATSEDLFVIDPQTVGSLDAFWEILLDPARLLVVHAGREDIRICYFHGHKAPPNVFDVQVAAGLVGITYPIGYAGLVAELLGQRMSKGETLTDWRRRPLLPAQVRYAFDDVRYLLPVWKKLSERLKRHKRTEWAAEEFDALVRRSIGDEESAAERWRRVKGIGGLDRRGLAIARELYNWREGVAERLNRPARYMLRDDLLAELARRPPSRVEDLNAFRGIPRGEVEHILEAIRHARTLPVEECPEQEARDNDPPPIVMLANLLGVVLADWAARNKVAANLVASGADLKALVRSQVSGQPLPLVPLTRGWRSTALLPELEEIMNGSTALRVAKPGSSTPLERVSLKQEGMERDPKQDRPARPATGTEPRPSRSKAASRVVSPPPPPEE